MEKQRWGFVGLVIDNRQESAVAIQELLTEYGDIIMGRMGVPLRGMHVCAISLIVNGSSEHTEVLAEKLAQLPGVSVSTCYSTVQPSAPDGAEAPRANQERKQRPEPALRF